MTFVRQRADQIPISNATKIQGDIVTVFTAMRTAWSDLRIKLTSALVVLLLTAAACSTMQASEQVTDNAQVQCDMVPIPSRIRGVVSAIAFKDDEYVQAGQLLATLEDENYRLRLAQLDAELATAKLSVIASSTQAHLTEVNARGGRSIIPSTVQVSEASLHTVTRERDQAQAAVDGVHTALEEARASHRRVLQMHQAGMVSEAAWESSSAKVKIEEAAYAGAQARLAAVMQSERAAKARLEESRRRGELTVNVEQPLIDKALTETELARANVAAAQAARDLVAMDLEHVKIYAAQSGVVSSRRVSTGQMIEAGQPLATLVTCPHSGWVVANFKETQVGRMRVGQQAKVTIDTYPGVEFKGVVVGMSGATGARFSLLPPENATGNFTRVVQRVPVRILLSSPPKDKPLRAGLSAIVTVHD